MAGIFAKAMQTQLPMILEKATPIVEAKLRRSWQEAVPKIQASVRNSIQESGKEAFVSQITTLIEYSEPQIETALRNQMRKMSPQQASMFLQNWRKLDAVVQQELGQRSYGGKRKTRRRKSRK